MIIKGVEESENKYKGYNVLNTIYFKGEKGDKERERLFGMQSVRYASFVLIQGDKYACYILTVFGVWVERLQILYVLVNARENL